MEPFIDSILTQFADLNPFFHRSSSYIKFYRRADSQLIGAPRVIGYFVTGIKVIGDITMVELIQFLLKLNKMDDLAEE